ncbi:hypothetical protein EMCG_07562, partial [[Emmonsia] crescens]
MIHLMSFAKGYKKRMSQELFKIYSDELYLQQNLSSLTESRILNTELKSINEQ